ncbi:MAG: NAD-dependent epimerase/dehydratase family protein [Candidatus Micrarchaeota archaeon]
MASILITGGAGFIGSNIAEELHMRHSITVLDNFSTGKRANMLKSTGIKYVEGDICDARIVRRALKGVQYVLHLAAIPSVPRSLKHPLETDRVNTAGTLNLLVESARSEVDRFVYASSSSVYGESKTIQKCESMTPEPISPYAVSKLAGEYYCSVFARNLGLSTVCLRYFNVFGWRQDPNSEYSAVIPKFISTMIRGKQPIIFGDGKQTRDFTYVKNIVHANRLVMESKKGNGEVFNIATGKSQSLTRLVSILNKLLRTRLKPVYVGTRPGDIEHSLADIEKARETFGYNPKWNFEVGLEDTVQWYMKK